MTRLLALLLGLTVLIAALPASASSCTPRVVVNGAKVQFDVSPVIENNRTLVPMRAIFEALGAEIFWDQGTQTVSAVREEVALAIQIGNPIANVNNGPVELDVPARIVGNRTLVPLRFISESLGAEVAWDAATCTAKITDKPVAHNQPPDVPGNPDPAAPDAPLSLVGFWGDNIHTYARVNAIPWRPAGAGSGTGSRRMVPSGTSMVVAALPFADSSA